jgi:sporulation protein YlmC with PRC-barrel domain
VGQAKDVILDLHSGRVVGFRAKSGPFTRRILPFDQVKAIGPDAITVASAAALLDARATPALLALAGEKYRRTDCRVLTESGAELGQLSWRDLRFDLVTGEVQIVLQVQGSSFTTYMVDLLFDVVSLFQPLDEWCSNPWHLELFLPLTAVLKVNRNLVIVRSQAEADCRAQQQAAVNRQQERLRNARECFKLTLARAWRRVTGKTP